MSNPLVTVLIPYYNFSGNPYYLDNLKLVTNRLNTQNVYTIIIEMVYTPKTGRQSTGEVPDDLADEVHQLHCEYMYWYKEILLNYGLTRLAKQCEIVAWIDGDILFENNNWVPLLLEEMNKRKAVQLFSEFIPLDEGQNIDDWDETADSNTAKSKSSMMYSLLSYGRYEGIHGLAWAMDRVVLEKIGFYDKCILGGGDKVLLDCCLGTLLKTKQFYYYNNKPYLNDILPYFNYANSQINKNVGMLKGRIFHLYHGKYGNRQYISRYSIFDKLGFDVQNNLTKENGIYNLNFDNQLSSWNSELSKYFTIRNRNF